MLARDSGLHPTCIRHIIFIYLKALAPVAGFHVQQTYRVMNPEEEPKIVPTASECSELVPTGKKLLFQQLLGFSLKVYFITQIVFYVGSLRLSPSDSFS